MNFLVKKLKYQANNLPSPFLKKNLKAKKYMSAIGSAFCHTSFRGRLADFITLQSAALFKTKGT